MNLESKKIWDKRLKRVVNFALKKGYIVEFFKPNKKKSQPLSYNQVDLENKVIKIYHGHCDEYKIYLLLHELGHVVINEDQAKFTKTCGFGQINFSRNSLTNQISVLEEELEAWKTGEQLAKEIKIKIDKKRFEKLKSQCVASYADHFLRKEKWTKKKN